MLGIDKALALIFRCGGISPSGTYIDKYFALTAVIVLIALPVERTISVHIANGSTERCFLTVLMFISTFGTIGLIMSNWIVPERFINIMNDLDSIGNQVQSYKDGRIAKITTIAIIILTLIQVAIVQQISFYFAMYLLLNIIFLNGPSMQQMVMVERIQNGFSAVNDLVAGLATETSRASTELDKVFQLHSSLQALVVDVDVHYCFFNLFNYGSKFIFCVFEMYGYLESIENVNGGLDFTIFISFLRQAVVFISQALVCHACSQEANRTVLLAHRVLQPDTPFELWEKIGLFSALAVDNKVHFTVGGIFTLDRALITQTALTALSYLIIAIQLREIYLF